LLGVPSTELLERESGGSNEVVEFFSLVALELVCWIDVFSFADNNFSSRISCFSARVSDLRA